MEGSRLAGWTRRRFGFVLGGTLGVALGRADFAESGAKKKRKKRCRKIQATCTPGAKRRCCKGLTCAEVVDVDGTHCCRQPGGACSNNADCCGLAACGEGTCKEE